MNWFVNLATRTKLMLSFAVIIVLFMIVIGQALSVVSALQASQQELLEGAFSTAVAVKDIRSNQNAVRADLLAMMLVADPSAFDEFERDLREREQETTETLASLLERNTDDPQILQRLQRFQSVRNVFSETRETQTLPLIQEGRIEEAKTVALGKQLDRDNELRVLANELVELTEAAAQATVAESARQAADTTKFFTLVAVGVIAISVAIALLLNSVISVPLRRISGTAERIASGDLTVSLPTESRSDEVGVLMQTFRRMVENLRLVMQEIRDGTNVLATAASEIVATTTQVATGATETATAVAETTSTVEEVKKTAELSSDKARYVSETAQKASQVSQSGRAAVEQSVQGVNRVREQMEALAHNIVRLSEQGQAIGEIIATVNDLAEQSNLLAVNAAIEAAKAGEQGKGFGVVAQEIKSLAEQSKQATTQVRGILGEIQRATAAAVLSAEQGAKAVEAGVKQSQEAGEAIKALAQSIAEAAQAATQIAASSRQQQAGMDQVGTAMENIRQASAQNVAGTKQAETAAQNLSALGQKLKAVVEQYRV